MALDTVPATEQHFDLIELAIQIRQVAHGMRVFERAVDGVEEIAGRVVLALVQPCEDQPLTTAIQQRGRIVRRRVPLRPILKDEPGNGFFVVLSRELLARARTRGRDCTVRRIDGRAQGLLI